MMTLAGPSQSGKTVFVSKLIKNVDKMIEPTPRKLLYLYSSYQSIYDEIRNTIKNNHTSLLKEYEFIDCSNGVPSIEQIKPKLSDDGTLVILDDLMIIAADNKDNLNNLNNMASRDSHHCNISTIFICQNMNYGNGKLRNVRTNSKYIVLMNNRSDFCNYNMVCHNKKLSAAAQEAIRKDLLEQPYGYVLFDGDPKNYENTRIRTNIFPEDITKIYYVENMM